MIQLAAASIAVVVPSPRVMAALVGATLGLALGRWIARGIRRVMWTELADDGEQPSPRRRIARRVTVLAMTLVLALPTAAAGQSASRTPPSPDIAGAAAPWGMWASAAGGLGNNAGDPFVDALAFHIQQGPVVVSARHHVVHPGEGNVVGAKGLAVGIATRSPGSRFAAISVGLSNVDQTGYFNQVVGTHRSAMGLVIAGDLALRAGRRGGAGVGITTFANLNRLQRFVGVGVEVLGGRWR